MNPSFVITTKALKDINKIYTKKDYTKEGIKGYIAADFYVQIEGQNISFIEVDEHLLCYSEIDVSLPEDLVDKYGDKFNDGLMPFDSLDAFGKVVTLVSTSDVVLFEFDAGRAVIDISTFGSVEKKIEYTGRLITENKSYTLSQRAKNFYNIKEDFPIGHKRDKQTEQPIDQYVLSSHIIAKKSDFSEPVRDAKHFDTRNYILTAQTDDEIFIEAQNAGRSTITKKINYTIPVTIDEFVPVHRSIGFGFSHFLESVGPEVHFFYADDEDEYSSCVLRSEGKNIKINALLNFNTVDEFAVEQEDDSEDDSDDDTGADEFGELEDEEEEL